MRVLTKEEFITNFAELSKEIKDKAIFIYPTDTIYGLGCNATKDNLVRKIREIKKREDIPFSVIAPSKEWIYENCIVNKNAEAWLNKLPGPYTLILKLKNKNSVSKYVAPGKDTLGIRIPAHWFSKVVTKLNIPIITTSANITGKQFMTSLEDLDPEIKFRVDFIVYEGPKQGRPSTIVDLSKEKAKIIER